MPEGFLTLPKVSVVSSSLGADVGKMLVDFIGPKEEIEKAVAYLKENGVRVEEEK